MHLGVLHDSLFLSLIYQQECRATAQIQFYLQEFVVFHLILAECLL